MCALQVSVYVHCMCSSVGVCGYVNAFFQKNRNYKTTTGQRLGAAARAAQTIVGCIYNMAQCVNDSSTTTKQEPFEMSTRELNYRAENALSSEIYRALHNAQCAHMTQALRLRPILPGPLFLSE